MTDSQSKRNPLPLSKNRWLQSSIVIVAVAVAIGVDLYQAKTEREVVPAQPPATTEAKPAPSSPRSADDAGLIIHNITLRDQDDEEIYRGDVDLRPTLERVAAGRELRFTNDGSTFQNRERRLPQKPPGYYREWVVPTPGESGPGPQRLVTGDDGEVWYTADHYGTFRRIPYTLPSRGEARDR
jgi:guanyl-specific ribonuclease Sa